MENAQAAVKTGPLLNKMLLLFMLAMILANMGGEMYGMLLPLYLKSLNASVVQIGLFFTISQIVPLAVQILGGWVSDTLGRLRSIAFCSVAGNLVFVGFIFAPTWQWVLSGQVFSAITRALIGPSYSAFIAEQSAEHNRARLFGISETLFMIVGVLGPPLGGYLVDAYGFRIMFGVAWLFYFLGTIIRVSMARTAARGHEAHPSKLSIGNLRANLGAMLGLLLSGGVITWILITDGIRDIAYSLSGNLMPVFLQGIGGMSFQQIGWLASIFSISIMLVTIPAGRLADKKGERVGIIIGFVSEFLAMVSFMQVRGFVGYAVVHALFGLGVGMMSPAYNSLISKAVPEKLRGTAFGLFGTSLGLVSLPAPWAGAQLWERMGPRTPFYVTGLAALASVLPAWLKFKLPVNKKGQELSEAIDIAAAR